MTPLETVNEFMARFCSMDIDHACELVTDDGKISLWRDYFDMGPVNEMFAALAR